MAETTPEPADLVEAMAAALFNRHMWSNIVSKEDGRDLGWFRDHFSYDDARVDRVGIPHKSHCFVGNVRTALAKEGK